jgi:hypothetical protein
MIRKLSSKLSSKWIVPVYVTTLASMIFIQCPKKQYKLKIFKNKILKTLKIFDDLTSVFMIMILINVFWKKLKIFKKYIKKNKLIYLNDDHSVFMNAD